MSQDPLSSPVDKPLVSVIIVNFNAGDYLNRAVNSVIAETRITTELIVVDNGSSDHSLDFLTEESGLAEHVKLIRLNQNLGFAQACNIGIKEADGDSLLFLNPDCVLYPGALFQLFETLKKEDRVGIVGPKLVNPDGSEQRGSRRDIPTPWQIFCVVLQFHRLMPNHPRFRDFNRHAEPLPPNPITVPAVSGACMLVSREAISEIGMMDGRYFLHFEDLDWCVRCHGANWQILFDPAATVEHTQGVCSRHRPLATELAKHRSLIRFLRKHFTSYYPSSFMALVSLLVIIRFGLTFPRLLFRALFRNTPPASVPIRSVSRSGNS